MKLAAKVASSAAGNSIEKSLTDTILLTWVRVREACFQDQLVDGCTHVQIVWCLENGQACSRTQPCRLQQKHASAPNPAGCSPTMTRDPAA